jgi:type VI secretion system VasD/TssJ family lipoprotein
MGSEGFGIAALAGLALGLAACAHEQPPPAAPCTGAEPIRVALVSTPHLNPDDKGEALATVVRLYQTKGMGKLAAASFDEFLDHDKDILGDDYIGMREVTINPGERIADPAPRNADAAYLVAVALFRKPVADSWRAVKKLAPPDPQFCHAADKSDRTPGTVQFVLDDNRIELR